jgi:hypothetical protein
MKILVRVALTMFVLSLLVLMMNVLAARRTPPAPRWSLADLPAAAADPDNGWLLVPDGLLLDVSAELPPAWAGVREDAPRRSAYLARDDVQRALPLLAVFSRPRFSPPQTGPWVEAIHLHRLGTEVSLDEAWRGNCGAALDRARTLLRSDSDAVRSASSLLSYTVSLAMLGGALDLTGLLFEGCPAERAALEHALGELPERLSLRAAIIGEYTQHIAKVDALPWFLVVDKADMHANLDAFFEQLTTCVQNPRITCPSRAGSAALAPLHNPLGEYLVASGSAPTASWLGDLRADAERYSLKRAELLARADPAH